MKSNYLFVFVVIGIVLLSGCASYKSEPAATQTQQVQEQIQQQTQQQAAQLETKKFTVEGTEFKFAPAEIKVNKGDNVEITFKNSGAYGHDFVIEGYEKRTSIINKGKEEVLIFTADKASTFAFYCSVPGHRAGGMEGKLIVSG